jgi:hypothetical protein
MKFICYEHFKDTLELLPCDMQKQILLNFTERDFGTWQEWNYAQTYLDFLNSPKISELDAIHNFINYEEKMWTCRVQE